MSSNRFRAFDFHAECKGNNYDNVSFLIQGLQEVLNKQGWVRSTIITSGMTRVLGIIGPVPD